MSETIEGGCACGAVRYALSSEPVDCGWCHCRICQRVSGAPAMVFATVPIGHYRFISGDSEVGQFRSSSFGCRQYCKGCGTPLTMQVDHQPDTIDLAVTTLDDPERVVPGFHIFHESRIGRFDVADSLPRHDRFRPDTRGLDGTDPPDRAE